MQRDTKGRLPTANRTWFRALILATIASLSACSGALVEIHEAFAAKDGTAIDLALARCGREYTVEVIETAEAVRVGATDQDAYVGIRSGDCQDLVTIQLSEPLGDRALIDASRDQPVEVRWYP